MSFKHEATETAQAGCLIWIIGSMVALMILGIAAVQTGLHYTMLPWLRQQETAINRSSHGYIDAKQAVLLKLTQDAFRQAAEIERDRAEGRPTKNAEAQLKASLDAIEREAATLAPEHVPFQTRDLMARYGRIL